MAVNSRSDFWSVRRGGIRVSFRRKRGNLLCLNCGRGKKTWQFTFARSNTFKLDASVNLFVHRGNRSDWVSYSLLGFRGVLPIRFFGFGGRYSLGVSAICAIRIMAKAPKSNRSYYPRIFRGDTRNSCAAFDAVSGRDIYRV